MLANEPRAAVILDEIHAALLLRDYAVLADLTKSLEEALAQPAQKLDAAALAVIRGKADRNAATLIAVQRGIRAAVRRIAEIRSVSNGLVTYDRSGLRQQSVSKGLAQRL